MLSEGRTSKQDIRTVCLPVYWGHFMRILKELHAIMQLTRLGEYVGSVTIVTALGFLANTSGHSLTFLPVLVLFAMNTLNFAFSFMINDIEDADNDSLDTAKVTRNPVSAGRIGKSRAYLYTLICGLVSVFISLLLGWQVLFINTLSLALGFVYSWRKVRLKSYPVIDFVSHALFLGTLQYLSAVFVANSSPPVLLVMWGALSIFSISVIGDLRNELRDFAVDRKVGLTNTAQLLRLDKYERYFARIEIVPAISCLVYLLVVAPAIVIPLTLACGIALLVGYAASRLLRYPLRTTYSHQEIFLSLLSGTLIAWKFLS